MTGKSRKRVHLLYPQIVIAGLLACLLSSVASAGGTLQPFGDQGIARDFSLVDIKGTSHTLADYRGKIVIINFWASWCPPCIHEMPGMQRLQEKLAGQPFVILPINVGEKKYRVWKFVKLINFTLPVPLDTRSKVFADWGASILPTSFLLDTEGRIRYRVQGDLDWDSEEVISLIEELLNEEENRQ
jgi:thiol-disulfide isomerase/thioredoxin